MNFLIIFYSVILVVLGLYVFTVLTFSKNVALAYKYLGIYVIMCVSSAFFLFLFETELLYDFPHFLKITPPLLLAAIPAFNIAIRKMLYNQHTTRPVELLLFLPSLIAFALLVPFYLLDVEVKREIVKGLYQNPSLIMNTHTDNFYYGRFLFIMNIGFSVIMLIQSFLTIRKFRMTMMSNASTSLLKTFRFAVTSFTIIIITFLAYLITAALSVQYALNAFYALMIIGIVPVSYFLLYLLSNPEILYGIQFKMIQPLTIIKSAEIPKTISVNNNTGEYAGISNDPRESVLAKLEYLNYYRRIETFMNDTELFLETGFSMDDLAKELQLSKRIIRDSLRNISGLGYNAYINRHRINYFIRKMKNDSRWSRYTIESLAHMVGYQSPATFYKVFREMHDCTPKEYMERQNFKPSNFKNL